VSADPFRITVDRIEGDVAILDVNGASLDVPAAALPEGAGEGSVLTLALSADTSADETRSEAEARLKRLKKKNPPKMSFDL